MRMADLFNQMHVNLDIRGQLSVAVSEPDTDMVPVDCPWFTDDDTDKSIPGMEGESSTDIASHRDRTRCLQGEHCVTYT